MTLFDIAILLSPVKLSDGRPIVEEIIDVENLGANYRYKVRFKNGCYVEVFWGFVEFNPGTSRIIGPSKRFHPVFWPDSDKLRQQLLIEAVEYLATVYKEDTDA